jgi:hypothetical protein
VEGSSERRFGRFHVFSLIKVFVSSLLFTVISEKDATIS